MPTSPYGASKLMLEGYLSAYGSSYGLSSCALRFSNIYGPRSLHKGSVVAAFFKQVLAEQQPVVYGDGSQTRDYLYVGDLVEAIRVAMLSDVTGPYQLGSGHGTTLNELLAAMRTVTGLPIEVDYQDFRAGEVRDTWCQVDKARAGFGYDPSTPLEEGLRLTSGSGSGPNAPEGRTPAGRGQSVAVELHVRGEQLLHAAEQVGAALVDAGTSPRRHVAGPRRRAGETDALPASPRCRDRTSPGGRGDRRPTGGASG